ncbi:MAG: MGMT family protein [Acidimicrobiia bacterium]|nr:MGMT family protein [Acidimicrobiia bacterium]
MTDFEDAVLEVIGTIRRGEVMTYGEVAAEAGFPGAARAVGNLLRVTGTDVPWWRVVGAGGHLRSPDPGKQARRLAEDGVLVDEGRVIQRRPSSPRS